MDINLCLPVPKYFYLEGVDPSGKSAWNHLQHNDMFVLVKGHEADGTMMMTLFAGNSRLVSETDPKASLKTHLTGPR